MTDYIDVDVRPILRAGGEPFSTIMAALETLEPGQGLRLYAPFKPIPLFGVMADKGFAHTETELDDGEWEVLFTSVASAQPAAVAPEAFISGEWPDPVVTLDNRDLAPPEPMVRILAACREPQPRRDAFGAAPPRAGVPVPRAREARPPLARRVHARRFDLRTHRAGVVMMPDLATMVRDALRVVLDPELGHNIVDLGFVYDITVLDGVARITMTATTPGCPAAGFLKAGVASSARQVPGIRSVEVDMTFDPPWTPSMIAPDARASLGFAAVN